MRLRHKILAWISDNFSLCLCVLGGVLAVAVVVAAFFAPDRNKHCCAWENYNTTCSQTGMGISHKDGSTSSFTMDVPCVKRRCYMYVVNYRDEDGEYLDHKCPSSQP